MERVETMKITLAQLNPLVGDVAGNTQRLVDEWVRCHEEGSDLLITPELYLCGYPPQDLLERPRFIEQVQVALQHLRDQSQRLTGCGLIVGAPVPGNQAQGKGLINAALLIYEGDVLHTQGKSLLPIYDVFDEGRYFDSAAQVRVAEFKGFRLGISICEDAWNTDELWPGRVPYTVDPIALLAEQGAQIIINISASPFHRGKEEVRFKLIQSHARRHGLPFVYVNQVGGNDELLFDGRSLYVDAQGRVARALPGFREHMETVDTVQSDRYSEYHPSEGVATVYEALVMGIRDYLSKTGFKQTVMGLSGGIDSAVTAVLACRALGPKQVLGITMPSPFSSRGSVEDSRELAVKLGMTCKVIGIEAIYNTYLQALQADFPGQERDVAEENIQARIRGNLLMAYSNKFDYLVLSTGNKSELAVGYCTLYGDMSGGLSVLADVPKTMVYELAEYINRREVVIPEQIISKPPSAELRLHQFDQDTLPPYPVLDSILDLYVEKALSPQDIVAAGYDRKTVDWVVNTVNRNEYKRKQAAPGLKVTSKAFGIGRRMPVAARFTL